MICWRQRASPITRPITTKSVLHCPMPPRASVGKPEPPSTTVHQVQDVRRGSVAVWEASAGLRRPPKTFAPLGATPCASAHLHTSPQIIAAVLDLRRASASFAMSTSRGRCTMRASDLRQTAGSRAVGRPVARSLSIGAKSMPNPGKGRRRRARKPTDAAQGAGAGPESSTGRLAPNGWESKRERGPEAGP